MKVYIVFDSYLDMEPPRDNIVGVFVNEEDAHECCRRNLEEENDDRYVAWVDEQEVK